MNDNHNSEYQNMKFIASARLCSNRNLTGIFSLVYFGWCDVYWLI